MTDKDVFRKWMGEGTDGLSEAESQVLHPTRHQPKTATFQTTDLTTNIGTAKNIETINRVWGALFGGFLVPDVSLDIIDASLVVEVKEGQKVARLDGGTIIGLTGHTEGITGEKVRIAPMVHILNLNFVLLGIAGSDTIVLRLAEISEIEETVRWLLSLCVPDQTPKK